MSTPLNLGAYRVTWATTPGDGMTLREKTVQAASVVIDDQFAMFKGADGVSVYLVRNDYLVSIERVTDNDNE